jgi:predicted phosphodiesterase
MKLGIISDIHEDAQRLMIALKSLENLNCDSIICLGDISGFDQRFYSYQFSKNLKYCLDCINMNCRVIIPGNHDLFHIQQLPQYNSIFPFPENWYSLSFNEKKKLSNGVIWINEHDEPLKDTELLNEVILNRSDMAIIEDGEDRILFTHSVYPDISGFLTKKPVKLFGFSAHLDFLESNNCNIGISGHFHPNGLMKIEKRKVHKPKLSTMEVSKDETVQFICPCIADGVQDNAYTVYDTTNRTIESIPLRTPKYNSFFL